MVLLRSKFLSSASIALVLISLTACGVNKPDHPQKEQSFDSRRTPKDNTKASAGSLGTDAKKKVAVDYSESKVKAPAAKPANNVEEKTFFEKLMGNTGSEAQKSDQQSSIETFNVASLTTKRLPAEQSEPMLTYSNEMETAQGSKSSQSYFDIAEPINSAPIHPIVERELPSINLINNAFANESDKLPAMPQAPSLNNAPTMPSNAPTASQPSPVPAMPVMPTMPNAMEPSKSAPLANIPAMPTDQQLKDQVANQPIPQLFQVPDSPNAPTTPAVPAQPVPTAPIASAAPMQPVAPVVTQNAPISAPHVEHQVPKNIEPIVQHHEAVAEPVLNAAESHVPAKEVMKPKVKKAVKKHVKKKAVTAHKSDMPMNPKEIKVLDDSEIVQEHGQYVTKKFLTVPTNR